MKDRLRAKKVNINSMFPNCNVESESIIHMLVTFSLARACWERVGMNVLTNANTIFSNWLDVVLIVYNGNDARIKVLGEGIMCSRILFMYSKMT